MLDNPGIRNSKGKAGTVATAAVVVLIIITLGVIYYAINLSPVGWRQDRTKNLPLRSETLATYLEDPSTCSSDLDKTYKEVSLIPKSGSVYDIKLDSKNGKTFELNDVDLRVFIPRIPEIVKGDDFLTHLTLVQRELNRNDTIFRNTKYNDYAINVANNCLRAGLWEAYVGRTSGDDTGKVFHGWFEFPVPLYKRLFKEMNGFDLDAHETAIQHYLRPDGKTVNLSYLREVKETKEIPVSQIKLNHDNKIVRMGEQQAKAKLVVNPGLHKFSDIYKKENQPIKLMQFDEPGIYKKKKLMKFDFSFLGNPKKVELKKAYNPRLKETFNELDVTFPYGNKNVIIKNWPFMVNRSGLKLVLGGWKLDDIPIASESPIPARDFARFTFGTGTPDIYVTYEHRLQDLNKNSNVYLHMVDENNKYVDNHTLGLDQVYISRFKDGTFVLYLVSYERIMLVAQWNFKPPEALLVSSKTNEPKAVVVPDNSKEEASTEADKQKESQ